MLQEKQLRSFFEKEHISLYALLPLEQCTVIHQRLLDRSIPQAKSVLIFAVPYYSGKHPERNLSLYCLSLDYHLYMAQLHERLIAFLSELFPDGTFVGFADHSPIDERNAAAKAGLGKIGDHRLLITEKYGSYVFLAEVLTDLPVSEPKIFPIAECLHCKKCRIACPCHLEGCASGIGQKKGELSLEEQALLFQTGLAWGCDRCQEVCPLNQKAEHSPIPFFNENILENVRSEDIENMPDAEFKSRAFSWRGRQPLIRNLTLFENRMTKETENKSC